MNKLLLRSQMRSLRESVSVAERSNAAYQVLIELLPLLSSAKNVAIYHAIANELSLNEVIKFCHTQQIKLFSPIAWCNSKVMRFDRFNLDVDQSMCVQQIFYPMDYRFLEEIKWYNLDLVLVPLLAVDRDGYRLGQGGGYYDTTFANRKLLKPVLCGVGYDWQIVDKLTYDIWDLRLDYFVSPRQVIKF